MTVHSAQTVIEDQDAARPPLQLISLAQLHPLGTWQTTLPHSYREHLFLWITRGQGVATIRGVRRGLGINNVIYLPAGTQFSMELGPQCFGQAILIRPGMPSLLPNGPQHLRSRDVVAQGELAAQVEMVQREQAGERPMQAEGLQAKFALIALWLRRQMIAMQNGSDTVAPALPNKETAGQRLCRRFADAMEQDFRSGRTMADYAATLDVTPTHLTRVSRDCAGKTAADLITARTLHEARTQLALPVLSIQDVAASLGFNSAAYFTRFIQHHTGKTPTALRASHLKRREPGKPTSPLPVFRRQGQIR